MGSGDDACGGDPSDLVANNLGEPQCAVRAGRDALGNAGRRGNDVFGDGARGGDAPDLVARKLGKPQRAVGSRRDARRLAAGSGNNVFGDGARGRDAPDLVAIEFGIRYPSGPAAMPNGSPPAVGTGNSVTAPAVVIRPIWLAPCSANHSAPSGPVAMILGPVPDVGTVYSVMVCANAGEIGRAAVTKSSAAAGSTPRNGTPMVALHGWTSHGHHTRKQHLRNLAGFCLARGAAHVSVVALPSV